jgi:multidrug resistance efflux pump
MGGKPLGYLLVGGIIGIALGGAAVAFSTTFKSGAAQVHAVPAATVEVKKPAEVSRLDSTSIPTKDKDAPLEVRGRTEALPSHSAQITPTVLHPVVRVLVVPGESVEKGQPLVELESHGPEADVRARRAEIEELTASLARFKAMPRSELQAEARADLDDAQVALKSAVERLTRAKKLHENGALPEGEFLLLETAQRRAEAEARADDAHLQHLLKQPVEHEIAEMTARITAAQAKMESAMEELEHHTVCASISGIVEWLNVQPGAVTRPGMGVWGEIYDLSQIDVRAELTLAQIRSFDSITDAQVDVVVDGWPERTWKAEIVFVGKVADANSGLIPIVARVTDAGGQIPCKVPATVRLARPTSASQETKPGGETPESASSS